jgi:hypothetical protein
MRKLFIVSGLTLLLFLPLISLPQTQGTLGRRFFSNWSISLSGGPNIFFGDLKVNRFWPASTNMNEWRFAGSFMLIRQISHVFAIRGQLLYGQISGTKRNYKDGAPANQYFEGDLFEYNLNATINFSNLFFRYKPQRKFFIYGTVGAGLSNWYTKVKNLQTHEVIGGSGSPSNWTTELVIPAGLGAYVNLGDKVNLGLEWTLRALNSDKLDGTVGGYPYDMYTYLALTVTYNFNKRNSGKLAPARYSAPKGVELPPPPASAAPKTEATQPAGEYEKLPPPLPPPVIAPEPLALKTEQESPAPQDTTALKPAVMEGTGYRVQVFASHNEALTAGDIQTRLHLKMEVAREVSGEWIRYTVGEFSTRAKADQLMKQLRARGVKGAFVVKYVNGARVP